MRKKAVVVLSGGMDSTTLLYKLIAENYEIPAVISFNYGQRHVKELGSARKTIAFLKGKGYNLIHHVITVPFGQLAHKSSLTGNVSVPEGHYEAENMKLTVVPNRNAIFINIAASMALTEGSDLALGVHAGDHFIYLDCREEFIQAAEMAIKVGNSGAEDFRILAPFLHISKGDIVTEGLKAARTLGIPPQDIYKRTWTCFTPGTLVHTEYGLKPIETIKTGDRVYTHKGRLRIVYNTLEREINENILKIKPYGAPAFCITKEHPVYTTQGFIESGKLKSRDNSCKIPFIPLEFPVKNYSGKFCLTEDFALFLGLFAAEGSYLTKEQKSEGLDFSINTDELNTKQIQNILDYLRSQSVNAIYIRQNKQFPAGTNFGLFDVELTRKLEALIGLGLAHERFFDFVLGWDKNYQDKFLEGFFFGDGFCDNQTANLRCGGTNANIANCISNVFFQRNIPANLIEVSPENCNGQLKQYHVTIRTSYVPELLAKLDIEAGVCKKHNPCFIDTEGNKKINYIEEFFYSGKVHNLSVEEDESYIVATIPVHNCYKGLSKACGKCGSCVERILAFHDAYLANTGNPLDLRRDPVEYEKDWATVLDHALGLRNQTELEEASL